MINETPTITQTPVSVLIDVGDGVGLAGMRVNVPVTLNSSILMAEVAGTGNDITFDNTALGIDPSNCFPNPLHGKIISAAIVNVSGSSSTLRVFVQGGGCSGFQYGLMIEEGGAGVGDQAFESNGVRLFVDPVSISYLKGAEVDFVDTITGGGFTIKNPNATSTCGCGQSFNA